MTTPIAEGAAEQSAELSSLYRDFERENLDPA